MDIDYIIVGRGLAGSILAYMLKEKGKNVVVVSNETIPSASSIAAGIFNPITGKRMTLTWKANILFPFLYDFYENMQKKMGVCFFHSKPIYRPFSCIEEQNTWIALSVQHEYKKFIQTDVNDSFYSKFVHNPHGGFMTIRSGYVDIPVMLSTIKYYLASSCIEDDFYSHEIVFYKDKCEWNGITAKKIIFCEGAYASKTPYFRWLPFVTCKGEILTTTINGFYNNCIFNKGIFILPLHGNIYKIGSTYEWEYTDPLPTEKAKKELMSKAYSLSLIKLPIHVISQQAGIRPTVRDRKPLLGIHPKYPTLAIFNGLGTKGVSLAPYYAQIFCDFLVNQKNIPDEVNIERYYSLYSYSDSSK